MKSRAAMVIVSLTFCAVETGIESGAGVWGYTFLTAGRGLPYQASGAAVSAYWAMMFIGRAILGPVAERVGPGRVLACAVASVAVRAVVMAVPGPGLVAVIGMTTVGLAAAPIPPLFTLTTMKRVPAGNTGATTRTVSLQVAASAIGGSASPAVTGLVIGAFNARTLAPALLILGVTMCGIYTVICRASR